MIVLTPLIVLLAIGLLYLSLRSRTRHTCPQCGTTVVVEHMRAEHCGMCGADLAGAAPEPALRVRAGEGDEAGVVCPFCREQVTSAALRAECADCGTPHHLACYEEQGGCSIYGCRSRAVKARVPKA